ncbi:hypothetical protein Taro_004505 [Colocasia esculenta]|uniref:Uncharacterized protein n=1 Tax=Colocasia esculenta TaxID=4460 RepID=A0A843TRV5_COLES|nr:hypothetical protein [Colocasia esculenta]
MVTKRRVLVTLAQSHLTPRVVSTQCIKYKANRSSSVDTSPGSVDTRDSSQNTFWPSWDSVSTLAQCVDTSPSSVDTSPSSVDTSALPEQNL